jgi:hypothetical protein
MTVTAQPSTRSNRNAFFFGGQDDATHVWISVDTPNHMSVTSIGHV